MCLVIPHSQYYDMFPYNQLQYEERIKELECQLAKGPEESERPHTHSAALQRELDSVRERHRRKVDELEREIATLQREGMVLKHRETGALTES